MKIQDKTREELIKELQQLKLAHDALKVSYEADMVEKKQAIEALQASEEKMHSIYRVAPTGIGVVVHRILKDVNLRVCEMTGYSREELLGKSARILYPTQEDYEFVGKNKYDQIRNKGTGEVETRWKKKNGSIIHVLLASTPIDLNDYSQGVIFTALDITERKQAEEALSKSESETRALLDGIPESAFLIDKDGFVIAANATVAQRLKVGKEDLIGSNVFNTVPKEVADHRRKFVDQAIKTGKQVQFQDLRFGRIIDNRVNPVFDPNGKISRLAIIGIDITHRIKAAEALQESEEKFRSLANSAKVMISIVGDSEGGKYLYVNDEWRRVYGYSKEDKIDIRPIDTVAPEDRKMVLDNARKRIEGKLSPSSYEMRIITRNGEMKYLDFSATTINFGNQKVLLTSSIDITERKKTEEALYKSKRSLESFLKISQTINTTMDIDNVLQMVVDKAAEVMGLNSGAIYQIENETLQLMAATPPLPKNLPDQVRLANLNDHPHVKKAITTGQPVIMADALKAKLTPAEAEIVKLRNLRSNLYLPIKTKNHTTGVLILTSLETTHNFGDDEINHIQGFANQAAHIIENARNYHETQSYAQALEKEIFERNRAEKALKASEQRFRNILQNVKTVAVQGYTMDGTVIYWNQASSDFYGFTEQEAMGKNLLDLIIPEGVKDVVKNEIKTMKETGIAIPASELTLIRKDGSPITIFSSHSYVELPGKDAEFYCIDTDLTERIKAEEIQKELEIANKTARFKQNFLANMSHEIRTPLTGVLGMIEIMEHTPLTADQKDYLDTIKLSGENLREIINQVLDYSKIEAGKITLHPLVFEYASLPLSAISLYKNNVKAGVQFQNTIDPDIPPWIEADNARLAQVLNNLASNAVKFTSKGVISIHSSLVSLEHSNGKVIIKVEVTDTGPGIPENLQAKLFIPFSQVEAIDTRNFEGTGLGLSICKQLVEMMGGKIGVISKEGKGSTFWFTFPALIAHESTVAAKNTDARVFSKKLLILLAEDKIVNQKVVKLMLTSMGHEVHIAKNGQEAIKLFQPGLFDIILMDIQMPVMNGIAATKMLKEKYQYLPPIVGLSANAFEGDRQKYMAMGMDDYLTKPVKKGDLEKLIRKLFSQTQNPNPQSG